MGAVRAAIAGLERTEILERVWAAKEEKRRRGELAQSKIVLPYGVGYEAGRGFFYKPEAERVREAFRLFLAGNQSYNQLAELLGVTPRGANLILRNPIWTGWRVIDKKRDPSPAGRYRSANGRQADRRTIPRRPEDIIRVRVIDQPLVSDEDFQAVQRIMDLKQSKHWRTQNNVEHRFTYNGFLTCSECGKVIHTALARRDYYACSGRRVLHTCTTAYMGRERLEGVLDAMFGGKLTDREFVEKCVRELQQRDETNQSAATIQRLTAEITKLRARRSRVVDSFVDGTIDRAERDRRLAVHDQDIQRAEETILRQEPDDRVDSGSLVEAFAPLVEWEHWTRDQKRLVLATMAPDIRVADYKIESLGLNPTFFSNESTRPDRDSSPPPA